MEQTQEELIKRNIQLNRRRFVADIVLIVLIAFLTYYVIREIESFKILGQNVCQLCMEKTGATCFKLQP